MQFPAGWSPRSAVLVLVLALLPAQRGPALATRRTSRGPVDTDVPSGPEEAEVEEAPDALSPDSGAAADAVRGSGAGAGGGLDVAGLQRSLKEGGVEGLNKMLKAFQAMGSLGSANMAAHIKKDADGNDIYDFRDLDETGGVAIGNGPAGPKPAVPAQRDLMPPGVVEPPLEAPGGAATTTGPKHPQEAAASQKLRAPAAAAPVRAVAPQTALKGAELPAEKEPVLVADSAADTSPLAVKEDSRELQPDGAVAKQQVLATASIPTDGSAGQLAAIAHGLDEVRRGVDTLVSLSMRGQGSPSGMAAPRRELSSGENAEETRQLVSRLEEVEKENSRLQGEIRTQDHRLDAMEAAARREDRRLDQVVRVNRRLHAELMMVQGHEVLLRRSEHHSRHHGRQLVRTFFHSKGKASLSAARADVVITH